MKSLLYHLWSLFCGLVVVGCMLIWVLFFVGCVDQDETEPYVSPCGPRPGLSLYYDGDRVTMPRAQWEEYQTWAQCEAYD